MENELESSAGEISVSVGAGRTLRVAKGSVLATVLAPAPAAVDGDRLTVSPMSWSLGLLGDLLWRLVPESRSFLVAELKDELDVSEDADHDLTMVSAGTIASVALWYPLLKPALDGFPKDRDKLGRYLEVVKVAWLAGSYSGDLSESRDALHSYVYEWIANDPKYLNAVEETDSELYEILYGRKG